MKTARRSRYSKNPKNFQLICCWTKCQISRLLTTFLALKFIKLDFLRKLDLGGKIQMVKNPFLSRQLLSFDEFFLNLFLAQKFK